MSDTRALLVRRGVETGDGVYVERRNPPVHRVEAWLRALLARFAFGTASRNSPFVHRVNALEADCTRSDDAALRLALHRAAQGMRQDGFRDQHLALAFAAVREASRRLLDKRQHDVQLLAGAAMLRGRIVEMETGEGKTLAGLLAACTAAAAGAAVHLVTVNDYLAERDARENGPVYAFFGLSTGLVTQDMEAGERRRQYAACVVHVSNKELTFDYLKDRIAHGGVLHSQILLRRLAAPRLAAATLLRGLQVAIVDEADSVLIDEARTPLIISETLPHDVNPAIYAEAVDLAGRLDANSDYVHGPHRDIWLTPAGEARVAALVEGRDGVWNSALWRRELLNKALSAVHLFHRDQHYIVAGNKVHIVDEFTGRVMPDRSWERGLHQMIEAKEGCEITAQRRTLSQITYQRFFAAICCWPV